MGRSALYSRQTAAMLAAVGMCFVVSTSAQTAGPQSASAPVAASAPTAVPALVPFAATTTSGKGEVGMTFLLFQDQAGGEPLWTESQRVTVDAAGRYAVQLGASSPSGLPLEVFANGTARWLEVQIAGQKPQPRVMMATVPYAAKAADAATLGGLPASAFALANPGLKGETQGTQADAASGISSDTVSNVTTTGGTSGYVPLFNGTNTVVNSVIYNTGAQVGIGRVPTAGAILDVNGAMVMRGRMTVSRTGNATASQGYPSYGFDFFSNAYNSSKKTTANPYFELKSEPTGNNTSNPSATFNLLFANNGTIGETGFYVNPNGQVHFASGQTFPGTGTGNGTITGVTASTGLSGGGTSGNVSLAVDTTQIPTLTDNPQFIGTVNSLNNTQSGDAFYAESTATYAAGLVALARGDSSYGTFAETEGAGSYAVAGEALGGPNGTAESLGVYGYADSGIGVLGQSNNSTGVFGYAHNISNQGSLLQSANGFHFVAGVWGDTALPYYSSSTGIQAAGLIASADDASAAVMKNDSSQPTLALSNGGSGGSQNAVSGALLRASSRLGSCTIGGSGDLTCTGQMKTLATTGGARKVETYAMQSPENWMEDFGSGTLSHGTATVTIDAAFAETANTGADYHVFLTPNGDSKGLYVVAKTATTFEVRESGGGTASLAFDYRIVAKRKGFEAQRLTDVTERFNADAARDLLLQRPATGQHPAPPAMPPPHRLRGQVAPTAISSRHPEGN